VKYCTVQELIPRDEQLQIIEEDIMAGEFPWSALTGT